MRFIELTTDYESKILLSVGKILSIESINLGGSDLSRLTFGKDIYVDVKENTHEIMLKIRG
jgi:hypothetical protein